MRRLLLLGLGSALVVTLVGVGPAQADNGPHVSSAVGVGVGFNQLVGTDGCASCHRAHTAQPGFLPTSGQGQDGLCLNCHGPSADGASTDVIDGVGYEDGGTQTADLSTAPGALRGGGFDHALIGSGNATRDTSLSGTCLLVKNQVIPVLAVPQATTSKHSVTGTAGTPGDGGLNWGTGSLVTLECTSCHDPHGNGNYRVLRAIPVGSGVSTLAVGVTIPDAHVKVYTTTNYWLTGNAGVPPVVNGVKGGTAVPDGYIVDIAQWCATCHSLAHSDASNKMGGANCLTCHVAHGSNASVSGANSSQVKQPYNSAAASGSSSLLRVDGLAICLMCHNV